jgi:two-component system, LytTR family, response regulator
MKPIKSYSAHLNEALIVRPEISFSQAMKAAGKISLSLPGCTRYLYPDEILYIKADSNYSEIYLSEGQKLIVSKTLKKIEAELPAHIFFRVHRGYSVNIRHISHLNQSSEGYTVVMSNKKEIPVSRDKKSIFII